MRRTIAAAAALFALAGLVTLRSAQPAEPARATTAAAQTTAAADPAAGKAVYEAHCIECHGASGHGDGPSAFLLSPRPRNFTEGRYKIRTTESGSIPTDDDLRRSVRLGLFGTAMPGWQQLLSADQIAAVVDYIKSFSGRFAAETPQPVTIPANPPKPVPPGLTVYRTLQCGKCHGDDGRGAGAVATDFEDDWRQPLRATDLTEPWTFHGGAEVRDVFLRFRTGMSGTPMPSFKGAASDAEMWALAEYVVSLGRRPVWMMTAAEVTNLYARSDAEARADPVRRGRNLVDSIGCALCHTPVDENKLALPGMKFAGGLRVRVDPYGEYPTGNLTSDPETGLGAWTDDEIKRTLTRGILRDGTRLLPYPMDWPSFSTMTAGDLDAIVAYLRTVPPVYNKVPKPSRTPLLLHLWGKFQMLFLGGDPPMTFFAGNAGITRPKDR